MEYEPKSLTVRCNKKAVILRYAKVLIPALAVALAAVLLLTPAGTAPFFAGILVLSFAVAFYAVIANNASAELTFLEKNEYRGARVSITAGRQTYDVWDIPGSDCVITQSKTQLEQNRGNVRFKNTRLNFYEVENVSAVKEFLELYFPKSK